ncbi:MAG: NAD(+) synthase [Planctomycetota bacterium]|nr:MAG: NAD(+) synthase [Planctomycetota bacterium]
MPPSDSPLTIDARREARNIERHIQELIDANLAEGVIIGLSGGIDSAVLAALSVRAVGTERVSAYYLYDRDSSKESQAKAKFVAEWLRMELKHHDITPSMQKMNIYSPLIVRITTLSGFINRCLNTKLHRLFHGELPFISILRKGSPAGNNKSFFYNRTVGSIEAAFNARHIYRRKFLEQRAQEKNRIVLGAANRSELMVGWFVKDGVDDLPFSPLIGLYKTQVLQLAKYLGLPSQIQDQAPSPDMLKGITDESALGISYDILDLILHYIDRGMSDWEIVSSGISIKDLRMVHTMNSLSVWKRRRENPAVSGEKYAGSI